MKLVTKHFLFLSAPALLLLGFGLLRPSKPVLRLKSVQVKPATDLNGRAVTAVEVFIENNDSMMAALFAKERILYKDPKCGVYVEDKNGAKYGLSFTATDRKAFRPFVSKAGVYGIRVERMSEDSLDLRFLFPLSQIPKSAGKLTLKTILMSDNTIAAARLPLAVVVRQ